MNDTLFLQPEDLTSPLPVNGIKRRRGYLGRDASFSTIGMHGMSCYLDLSNEVWSVLLFPSS